MSQWAGGCRSCNESASDIDLAGCVGVPRGAVRRSASTGAKLRQVLLDRGSWNCYCDCGASAACAERLRHVLAAYRSGVQWSTCVAAGDPIRLLGHSSVVKLSAAPGLWLRCSDVRQQLCRYSCRPKVLSDR